jgi:hypothetical protein
MSKTKEIAIEAQKEIQRLTAEIDRLKNVIKACEITGKATSAVLSGTLVNPEAFMKVKKQIKATVAKPRKNKAHDNSRDVAIAMLKKEEVRPLDLAKKAQLRNEYASALLTKLVEEKIAKKVSRGVYTIRS